MERTTTGARSRGGVGRGHGTLRRAALAVGALALLASAPAPGPPADPGLTGVPQAARALRGALDAPDAETRDAALVRVARDHPLVGDHVHRVRAELLLQTGALEGAIRAARRGLADHPETPLRARLHRLEGDAFLAAGNEAAARSAWQQALAAEPSREARTALELELAGSLERAGLPRSAAGHYLRVWREATDLEASERAGARLEALEEELGEPLRTPERRLERADALLRHRRTEAALGEYERALAGELEDAARRAAATGRARALFRLRRYPEAVEAFSALAAAGPRTREGREARLWAARARARTGDVDGAVDALLALAGEGGPLGLRARYLAALLLEDDDPERATAQLEMLVGSDGRSGLGRAARWSLGWAAYRSWRNGSWRDGSWRDGSRGGRGAAGESARLAEARAHLERLAAREPDPIVALRARYWVARIDEERGATRAAREALAAIVAEYPLSYYGWRARARLEAEAIPAAQGAELPPGRSALPPRALARPRILLAAGLDEAGREELEELRGRARGRDDRLALASLYSEAGDHHAAQRLVVDAWSERLARGPAPGQEEAWWLAWPRAYDDLVRRFSGTGDGRERVEPALVYAIMREESGYRPEVVSTVGARGLLQIMPDTGTRLARDAGLPAFDADDLFDPRVNIRLGTHYLEELTRRFAGRASAAIGSYNAGPGAVARWLRERPDDRDDEWVESMPYQQTRRYVKRVLRSRHAYRVLY